MYELKTNTAVRIAVGPLVDPGDYKTAETSLTVTGMSVEIFQVKGDGNAVVRTAFSPTASGGNNDMVHVTDDTTGMYDLELTAAQLNWLGNGRIAFYDVDGFIVHWIDIHVVSANYWDWKYGTGNVNSDVIAISGDTTAADNCELMFDGTGYAGGTTKLGVDVIAVSGDTDAADNLEKACDGTTYNIGGGAVVAASVTGAVGSVTGAVGSVANGGIAAASFAAGAIDAAAIANGAIDNATFAADVGSTAYATNIVALALRKALDEIKLDHLLAVADSDDVADNSVIGKLASTDGDWSKFSLTTDSLQSIRDKLPANLEDMSITDTTGLVDITQAAADKAWGTAARTLTALDEDTTTIDLDSTVAAAVWNAATASYGTSGTYGETVEAILTDTNEIQGDTHTAAETATAVWGAAARTLTTLDEDTTTIDLNGVIESALAASLTIAALPTAAENADAVWDEASTGHIDAGKAGAQLWTDIDAILVDTGTDGVLISRPSGKIVDDVSNSSSTFKTDLSSSETDFCKFGFIKMTSGDCTNQVRRISAFNGSTKFITLSDALTQEPTANDTFVLIVE